LSVYENYYQYTVASPEATCYSKKNDGDLVEIGDNNKMIVAI
jgi:hypothetical protein